VTSRSAFWDDLARDLEDPAFLREYVRESVRIATIDAMIDTLDEARRVAGMTKAELARAISAEPATVRRLLSTHRPNPTVGTLAELAAALGMKITLQPMPEAERKALTEPLLRGKAANRRALAEHLTKIRESGRPHQIA
jgi:transcriptional regulator with XRE-family HTH domain